MATVRGVNNTAHNASPPGKSISGQEGGRVLLHYDKFTLTADLSANDVIEMGGLLPKGALIIDAMVKFANLDASGGTIDFGYLAAAELDSGGTTVEAADENAFLEAADVTSANVVTASDNQASPDGIGKVLDGAVQPAVKIEGDTDATSGDVETFIWYVVA